MHTTYDIAGPTSAPAIVLLHAASYTRRVWLPQMGPLAEEFRVLAPDLPAHGTLARQRFTFDAAIQEVVDTLAQERIDNALLVGVSLGGCVAIEFAARYPKLVAGLVLSGCSFDAHKLPVRLTFAVEQVAFRRGARLWTRAFLMSLRRRFPPAVANPIIIGGTYWDGAAQGVRAISGNDFAGRLRVCPAPVLILNGDRDWVHRTAERKFARNAPEGSLQILPSAGHIASLDQPDAFTAAVRAFARTVFSPAPLLSGVGGLT